MILRRSRNRRGLTFVEMMISITITSAISVFVITTVLLAARNSNRSLSVIPAETNTYRAMDRIRLEILPAKLTTVKTQDNGHELVFTNPALQRESMLDYNSENKKLTYFPDTSKNDSVEFGNFESVEFQSGSYGRNISVKLVANSKDSKNSDVPLTHQEWITVRN